MGDRANVHVHDGDQKGVYLYTHWAGTELPEVVRTAMQRASDRWDDEAYLARAIFSEMVRDDIDGTTGYGITAVQVDDRTVDVDVSSKTVTTHLYDDDSSRSFAEFVK